MSSDLSSLHELCKALSSHWAGPSLHAPCIEEDLRLGDAFTVHSPPQHFVLERRDRPFPSPKGTCSGAHYFLQPALLSKQEQRDLKKHQIVLNKLWTRLGPDFCTGHFPQEQGFASPLCSVSKIHKFFLDVCNFKYTPLFFPLQIDHVREFPSWLSG